jgi:hypothetical protein
MLTLSEYGYARLVWQSRIRVKVMSCSVSDVWRKLQPSAVAVAKEVRWQTVTCRAGH